MRKLTTVIAALLLAGACSVNRSGDPESLTLIAHDSFAEAVTDATFSPFTEATGIEVRVLAGGDAGAMVTQAVLTAGNPVADVIFGVDDTFLSRAIDGRIFAKHRSSAIDRVSDSLRLGSDDLVTPIDFGDVCINYDKAWFESTKIQVPTRLDELRAGLYAEHLVVEHPATSSPGLAFMLATIAEFGEDGWLDYWGALKRAGVKVVPDWNTAYYSEFTRYGGQSSMVVSYASSPPAEVIFADEELDSAPTGVIEASCYRQVEFAGVLDGTDFPDAAGKLVDFMLSVEFQETIPLNWFVFPANVDAGLPPEFVQYAVIPLDPARLGSHLIAENREAWIKQWADLMEG